MSDLGSFFTIAVTVLGGGAFLGASAHPYHPEPVQNAHQAVQNNASANGQDGGHLPVTRGLDGRLYITVSINETPHQFLVDTAATHSVLSAEVATHAGVPRSGRQALLTAGGMIDAHRGSAAEFVIGQKAFTDQPVLIVDGLPVSLLGMDILSQLEGGYIIL